MLLPDPHKESTARLQEAWEPEPGAPPLRLGGAGPASKVAGVCAPGPQSLADSPAGCAQPGAHLPGSWAGGGPTGIRARDPRAPLLTRLGASRRPDVPQVAEPAGRAPLSATPGGSGWPRTSRRFLRNQGAQDARRVSKLPRPPCRAGWRRKGTRRSWPACAQSSPPATPTARGAWSARSSARCARSCACGRRTPRRCSSGWTRTATAPSHSRSSRSASAGPAAVAGAGAVGCGRGPLCPSPTLGPIPGTARRTRTMRTRPQRCRRPHGPRLALAPPGGTSRRDSGRRPSSSPGACLDWKAGGTNAVYCAGSLNPLFFVRCCFSPFTNFSKSAIS